MSASTSASDLTKTVSNADFRGNIRGKCKNEICDCEEYLKTDEKSCGMCGCFPGKHELIAGSSEVLQMSSAVNMAVAQLTPSKVAEIREDGVYLMPKTPAGPGLPVKKLTFDGNRSEGPLDIMDVDNSSINVSTPEVPMSDEDEISSAPARKKTKAATGDKSDDEEFMCDETSSEAAKAVVEVTRNDSGAKSEFTSAAIKKDFLGRRLLKKIEEDGLLAHEDAFISEAATYLLALSKKEKPTPSEQTIFCSKMVLLYPELRSTITSPPWSAFKTTLSRHLIQRRYRAKCSAKSNTQGKPSANVRSCALVPIEKSPEAEKTMAEKIAELKAVEKNTPLSVVRKLLSHTAVERRTMMLVDDKPKSPADLVKLWPHTLIPDFLMSDFFTFKDFNQSKVEERVALFLRRLAKHLDFEEQDKDFAEAIAIASRKLNKQSKKLCNIVTILEPLGDLTPLTPLATEAPRLVFVIETAIDQCYLIFDGHSIELPDPSSQRAVILLMSAYYVMDIKYPDVYQNFLQLLDREISGTAEHRIKASQRTLFKFVTALDKVQLD